MKNKQQDNINSNTKNLRQNSNNERIVVPVRADSSSNSNEEEENKLVRFRRWIAMTPDCKWREFRGTANIVNMGEGRDLVELVDNMMLARINHFGEMMSGWQIMRNGLTFRNAEWIYSEMMTSLSSLQQFELQNFTNQNRWTRPRDISDFPKYLSDRPVREGVPLSAITTYQTNSSDQLMIRFIESDNPNPEEYLRMLFGDFVPESLRKMFYENKEDVNEQPAQFVGTSAQFIAQGRRSSESEVETPILTESSLSKPEEETTPVSQPMQCSGIGFTFNHPSRGGTRVTVMSNAGTSQPQRHSAPKRRSKKSRNQPPGPPSLPPPLMTSEPSGPFPQYFPSTSYMQNSQVLALLMVQRADGEMVNMGFVPVNYQAFVHPMMVPQHGNPHSSMSYVSTGQQNQNHNVSWNHRQRHDTFHSTQSTSENSSLQNDSGFCSASEPELNSTRGSTPASLSTSEAQSHETNDNQHVKFSAAVERELDSKTEGFSEVVPEFSGLSYAQVVSQRDKFESVAPAANLTSSEGPFTSSIPVTSSNIENVREPKDQVKEIVLEDVAVIDQNSSSSWSEGIKVVEQEWKLVKNKNPVSSSQVVVVVVPEPKKNQIKLSGSEKLAECLDDVVEIDEREEERREKRRRQRQLQRARKHDKRGQNVVEEIADDFLDNVELPCSSSSQETSAPEPVTSVIPVFQPIIPLIIIEEPPIYNSEGVRKLVDSDIIKEELPEVEEEEDEQNGQQKISLCEEKEQNFAAAKQHAKLVFRLLWFDNKKKIRKLYCDEANKTRLQGLLDMVRIMKERVDMAGRMIVYRTGRPHIADHLEETFVTVARNLIDVTRHQNDNDMSMAKTVCNLVGKITKNLTYMHYVFSILTLPEDFIPRLPVADTRVRGYKDITILTKVHMKRVEKIYEQISDLYEFKIERVPMRNQRRRN